MRSPQFAEQAHQQSLAIASSRHEAPTDAPLIRLLVEADAITGIQESSRLMVDKITIIPRTKLGERVGQLSDDDMIRLLRALVVLLGLAGA